MLTAFPEMARGVIEEAYTILQFLAQNPGFIVLWGGVNGLIDEVVTAISEKDLRSLLSWNGVGRLVRRGTQETVQLAAGVGLLDYATGMPGLSVDMQVLSGVAGGVSMVVGAMPDVLAVRAVDLVGRGVEGLVRGAMGPGSINNP